MGFKRSTFEPCPEGETIGTFVDFQDDPNGQYGPQIRLSFDTEELMDDERPFRVAFWITEAFNPKSNSYKFLRAMNVDVDAITDEDLEALDLNDFLNRKCRLVIEHKKKPDGAIKAAVANLFAIKPRAPKKTEEREPVGAGAAAGTGTGSGKKIWSDED